MGGFLGIGGSSEKTDRKLELGGFGDMKNLFNFGFSQGKSLLSSAGDYLQKLTSGNRTTAEGAVAPEVNQLTASSDASKRQLATSGTARGGGTAPANQTRQTDVMGDIDNLLFGAQSKAVGEEGKLGSNELNTSSSTAQDITKDASESRMDSAKLNAQAVKNVTNFAQAAMSFAFGF